MPAIDKKRIDNILNKVGPAKFNKIIQTTGLREFGLDGLKYAKSIYQISNPRGRIDELMTGYAAYFTKSDDGQNTTGTPIPLDGDKSKIVDNDGDWSGNPSKTGDGTGNLFNKPAKDEADDGVTMADNNNADLNKKRDEVGVNIVVPPYNKSASPETASPAIKDGESPYPVVTRKELDKTASPDNRGTLSSIYQDESKEAENVDDAKAHYLAKFVLGYISSKERESVPDEDFAGPHKSFPIRNQEDVHNAARLIGHGDNPNAIKHKIIEIAKRKGLSLPNEWKKEDASKLDFVENSGNKVPQNDPGQSSGPNFVM